MMQLFDLVEDFFSSETNSEPNNSLPFQPADINHPHAASQQNDVDYYQTVLEPSGIRLWLQPSPAAELVEEVVRPAQLASLTGVTYERAMKWTCLNRPGWRLVKVKAIYSGETEKSYCQTFPFDY
jgi:hypothetical protein